MVSAVQTQLIQAELGPAQTASQINYTVAAKSLDSQRQQGADIVSLIDSADSGNGGGSGVGPGDALVARATGLGGQLDTYA